MQHVEIRLAGHLDEEWLAWLGDFSLVHLEGGETLLTGAVQDQAEFYGLMSKLRDLGAQLTGVDFKLNADQR